MSLTICPECGKSVSSTALACPNCGFAVKEHFDSINKAAAELEEFNRTHKDLLLNDEDWFVLFTVYDYMVNRVTETSKNLLKYKKIWFNQGVPSYPLDFANGWWRCIEDGYVDIIKYIKKEMVSFSNDDIKNNIDRLNKYDYRATMRIILLRWNDLIMSPFRTNSPAILRNAEHNYAIDVARESQMEFGIITNSMISMALYAVQSSLKEANAINKAEANKQNYINTAMNFMQQNVSKAWDEHYEEFLKDVEVLHQLVIFELSNLVFDGYLFAWCLVDNEFIKPDKKQMYENRKAQKEAELAKEKEARMAILDKKRHEYIVAKTNIVNQLKQEISQYQIEIDSLGLALFGEKAEKKRRLKAKLEEKDKIYKAVASKWAATIAKIDVNNRSYIHYIFSGWDNYMKLRANDICKVVYVETTETYDVINENGVLVEHLPIEFTNQFGAFREFNARYDNCILHYQNNIEHDAQIFLSLTNVD